MLKKINFLVLLFLHFSFSLAIDAEKKVFLIFGGKTGWIGQKLVKIVENLGHVPICAESRLENREEIIFEIQKIKPNYIINAAGLTGRPNIDWCEDHKQETIRTNVIGALNLADIAFIHNISMTNFGTGCIYEYDINHGIGKKVLKKKMSQIFLDHFILNQKFILKNYYLNIQMY